MATDCQGTSLYNRTSVPDGGMTLMLLGGALVGIGPCAGSSARETLPTDLKEHEGPE